MVSVGPQGTQPVKFTTTKAQPGNYTVDILDKHGNFTVLGTGSTTKLPINRGLVVILVVGVLVLASIVVLMFAFRR